MNDEYPDWYIKTVNYSAGILTGLIIGSALWLDTLLGVEVFVIIMVIIMIYTNSTSQNSQGEKKAR